MPTCFFKREFKDVKYVVPLKKLIFFHQHLALKFSTKHCCQNWHGRGKARTQSPTTKNYAPELPSFREIVGVAYIAVQ